MSEQLKQFKISQSTLAAIFNLLGDIKCGEITVSASEEISKVRSLLRDLPEIIVEEKKRPAKRKKSNN